MRNPAQVVVASFVLLILIGSALLTLPWATDAGVPHPAFRHALFWATSASTVTGLGTIPVESFSLFGELVLLALIQIGGFGIMTIGSVLALVASQRVGLRQRMLAQAEIGAVDIGELRLLIGAIAKITVGVESTIAVILFFRFVALPDIGVGRAVYSAIFHSISSFNNAGISLSSSSMSQFVGDPFVVFPVTASFIIGGLGFPIFVELHRKARNARSTKRTPWTLHTKITLYTTGVLLIIGPLVVLLFEWTNPGTLGELSVPDKLQAAWFQGVSPRTAGFSTIDIGALHEPTLNIISALMFIGAGPASTSGGIKVTTFAVLGFAMWAEVRGDTDINLFRRRLPPTVARQALTVALLSIGLVFASATALTAMTPFHFTSTIFEAASAFGTVGLSTGITAALPPTGHYLLMLVMLIGRVGPITFVTALALKQRRREYHFAEERPIIG